MQADHRPFWRAHLGGRLNSAADPPSGSRSRSINTDGVDLHGHSAYILVVEDNPADVNLLKRALAEHGIHFQIVVMSDGERAMKFVDRVHVEQIAAPKLIILDLNLPKRNGREVLEYIRAQGAWSDVPVTVLSSSAAAQDREDAARLGASQYIRKPLDFDEFIAIGSALKALLKPE